MKKRTPRLTPNAFDALSRLAAGERVTEIAESWGMSKAAVYKTLDRAKQELGASSMIHAVVLYVREFGDGHPITKWRARSSKG